MTVVEMENFYSRCLLCTCIPDLTPHLNIFSGAGNKLQLSEKINKYLNIQIDGDLPQNVCHSCMEKLEVTHELVTSSQQARVTLLHIKQQSLQARQEISDPLRPATDVTVAVTEDSMDSIHNEDPMDLSLPVGFDQSDSALPLNTEDTEQTAEEMLISEIEIEEHGIKLESGEDPLETHRAAAPLNFLDCRVLVHKLLQCETCAFFTINKTQLASHMRRIHLKSTKQPVGSNSKKQKENAESRKSQPAGKVRKFKKQKCSECGSRTKDSKRMAWHMKYCHGDDPIIRAKKLGSHGKFNFTCVFCQTVCNYSTKMMQHLINHHHFSNLPYDCNICGKTFFANRDLSNHLRSCQKKGGVSKTVEIGGVKCKMCDKNFESETLMKEHISNYHAKKSFRHECLYCDESFQYFSLLKSHCQKQHPEKIIVQCEKCQDKFPSQATYLSHKKNNHTVRATQTFTCEICDKVFNAKCNYIEHKKFRHEGHKLSCNICKAQFTSMAGYTNHTKYKHKARSFICNICNVAFLYPSSLGTHNRIMHPVVQETFPCTICSATFKNNMYLQKHVRNIHTNPFMYCEHCKFSTRGRCNLVSHLQAMHLSKKLSFLCDYCGAKFRRKPYLALHISYSHTGKILQCKHCKYNTRRKDYLIKHLKGMHFNKS